MVPDLAVSFSGGKTSAKMLHDLQKKYTGRMVVCFMNTGCEDERTLTFADRCDRAWNANMVWLEAVVHPEENVGTTHKIVTFETAARDGEPFEAAIKKYGIPNSTSPTCTRELKQRVIASYLRSIGWLGNCVIAVGMRADEPRRLRADAIQARIVYPFAHWWPTTKPEVNEFWEEQPFTLELEEYEGNCMVCWRKSDPKLIRIAKSAPHRFEFNRRMESQYGQNQWGGKRSLFFRGHKTVQDIFAMAALLTPSPAMLVNRPDDDSGCSESCEVF